MTALPFWLKIVGPLVAVALVCAGILAWGHGKYNAGHKAGVSETDAKWHAASEKLKQDAAASATKADDAAVKRLEQHVEQQEEDHARLEEAQRNGSSPLDAIF